MEQFGFLASPFAQHTTLAWPAVGSKPEDGFSRKALQWCYATVFELVAYTF